MDKITEYIQIIKDILREYGSISSSLSPAIKREVIIDDQHYHYQLLSVGWHNHKFTDFVSFHFDIIDGKIWIQQNNTEALIADELIERGVEKTDIVLGFVPEEARAYSGFAVS